MLIVYLRKLLPPTKETEKDLLGFDKAKDPRLTRPTEHLDERARSHTADHLGSSESSRRRSHHGRVEGNAPSVVISVAK